MLVRSSRKIRRSELDLRKAENDRPPQVDLGATYSIVGQDDSIGGALGHLSGTSSPLLVAQRQEGLAQAPLAELEALFRHQQAALALEAAAGVLVEARGIRLDVTAPPRAPEAPDRSSRRWRYHPRANSSARRTSAIRPGHSVVMSDPSLAFRTVCT